MDVARRRPMRTFVFLLAVCVLFTGCARKGPKVYRVGIICGLDYIAGITDGFKSRMGELGYVEGVNIVYDVQRTNFEPVKETQILTKFVQEKVGLIFSFPTQVSVEAKAAARGTNVPVLFAFANIEDTGLVESVRHPGGNITGVRFPGPDLAIKRYEIMRELLPKAKRLGIPFRRGYPIVASQLKALHEVAAADGVTLVELPVDNAAELKSKLDARARSADMGVDAFLFIADPISLTPDAFAVVVKCASEQGLPVGGPPMSAGGYRSLFSVLVDVIGIGKQSADLADKILKGAPAGSLPAPSAEMVIKINYKAAQESRIAVGEGLLSQADEIVR